MRNRVDKLGVSEPEIQKQGTNQIVIQLAGVHDPTPGGEDHRPDRPARALRPRAVARPAVGRRDRPARSRPRASTTCSRASRRRRRRGTPSQYGSSSRARRRSTTGTGKNKKTTTTTTWHRDRPARPRRCTATRRRATRGCSTAYRRQGPDRLQGADRCRAKTVVITLLGDDRPSSARATRTACRRPARPTTTSSSTASTRTTATRRTASTRT